MEMKIKRAALGEEEEAGVLIPTLRRPSGLVLAVRLRVVEAGWRQAFSVFCSCLALGLEHPWLAA